MMLPLAVIRLGRLRAKPADRQGRAVRRSGWAFRPRLRRCVSSPTPHSVDRSRCWSNATLDHLPQCDIEGGREAQRAGCAARGLHRPLTGLSPPRGRRAAMQSRARPSARSLGIGQARYLDVTPASNHAARHSGCTRRVSVGSKTQPRGRASADRNDNGEATRAPGSSPVPAVAWAKPWPNVSTIAAIGSPDRGREGHDVTQRLHSKKLRKKAPAIPSPGRHDGRLIALECRRRR